MNALLSQKAEKGLFKQKHKIYEYGNKSGRYLSNLISNKSQDRSISSIKGNNGQLYHTNSEIARVFNDFYSSLYSSEEPEGMEDKMNSFFGDVKLPKVSDEDRQFCEMDITTREVEDVIATLASGKACGPDGLPPEIYKQFKHVFSPLLVRMYKHSLSIKKLPPSLQMSTIHVLHKENKDPLNPASYRPLSIQNTDCKILAKLLASRLNQIIPKIVRHDQTGFIHNRQSYTNIQRLLGVLQYVKIKKLDALVVTLDAEKAFDRIIWKYLFRTLQEFSFGEQFIHWV